MIVRVQLVQNGSHGLAFRALIFGGLLVATKSGDWDRKTASLMLDKVLRGMPNVKRSNIRFKHA